MRHVFLILASGKSSRFGGYPKAFCKVNGIYVAQRTVNLGAPYFDETYLVISRDIFPKYKEAVTGCKTLAIGTGRGDSHSFLRAARLIRQDCEAERITLCWGDTIYLDDVIFRRAAESELDETIVGISLASIDSEPYAWYETDGDKIKASHFQARDGVVETGIHDQSVFIFNSTLVCSQLDSYRESLGINDEEDYIDKKAFREMRLLDSFTYFYENHLPPMKYSLVEPGRSYSFNTQEELETIREKLRAEGRISTERHYDVQHCDF